MGAEKKIDEYFSNTLHATKLLYESGLYSQLLVLILSAIDSYGYLDSPPEQSKATGQSFKAWVAKYIIINPGIEYNEIDLWSSRCAVLHTHALESDLSKKGTAREIAFYSGDKFTDKAEGFAANMNNIESRNIVAANIEETYLSFVISTQNFARDLASKCNENELCMARLNKILSRHHV